MKTLGLDLGGTKIAAAIVEDGEMLSQHQVGTPHSGYEDVLTALEEAAEVVLADYPDVEHVGLGSPGPLDLDAGKVLFAPNIPGMEDVSIANDLGERLGRRVVLENDANAAGYAEHLFGAARELTSSIYVTISTGVGGGLFLEESIVHGADGVAGEVGHMTLQLGGPLCGCGHYGCWEAVGAGRAIARDASHSYGEDLGTKEVFERAKAGERKARQAVDQAARYTGLGLANLLKAFNPDGFVIGGGLIRAGDFYMDKVQAAADEFCAGYPSVELYIAELGTDAGVIGAASVATRGATKDA